MDATGTVGCRTGVCHLLILCPQHQGLRVEGRCTGRGVVDCGRAEIGRLAVCGGLREVDMLLSDVAGAVDLPATSSTSQHTLFFDESVKS